MNNSISFRAKLLHPVKIQKYDPNTKKYNPSEASFIEIDPNCKSDRNEMRRLKNEWYYGQYAENIYEDVLEMSSEESRINSKFYAITTQKKSLDLLDGSRILGITELELGKEEPYIEYLQVDPEFVDDIKPQFKYIGTGILNSLKKMYESIRLSSVCSALDFYLKNQFELIDNNALILRWVKK